MLEVLPIKTPHEVALVQSKRLELRVDQMKVNKSWIIEVVMGSTPQIEKIRKKAKRELPRFVLDTQLKYPYIHPRSQEKLGRGSF